MNLNTTDVTPRLPSERSNIRPQRADAQRNVERLVEAAREAFAVHGIDASLDDIARRAEVGNATLYRHFPTRLVLFEAVYRDGVERLSLEGQALIESPNPGKALTDWLRGMVLSVYQKRGLAAALTRGLGREADVFAEGHAMMTNTGSALLRRAQEVGAARSDVQASDLLRLACAIALAAETSDEGLELPERLMALAMEGIRPQPSAQ